MEFIAGFLIGFAACFWRAKIVEVVKGWMGKAFK
jgi:hypothetical protein